MDNKYTITSRPVVDWYKSNQFTGNLSVLWKEKKKDFGYQGGRRGYGLNRQYSSSSIKTFQNFFRLGRLITHPALFLMRITRNVRVAYNRLISKIILGDWKAAEFYQLTRNQKSSYDPALLQDFENTLEPFSIYYSHNSLKAFSYFKSISDYFKFDTKSEESFYVLEIGAGLFNFGHILSLHLGEFSYIVVDLPEMIVSAVLEIEENYDADYEIFLPFQMEAYFKSNTKRKLLFITPDQLDSINCKFDLFVNHESFGEMNIDTVNKYLHKVKQLMKPEKGVVFLVNRYARVQAGTDAEHKNLSSVNQVTSFNEYDLDFIGKKIMRIDPFRQKIKSQNRNPNVLFIGWVK